MSTTVYPTPPSGRAVSKRHDPVVDGRKRVVLIAALSISFIVLTVLVLARVSWLVDADTAVTREVAGTHNGSLNRAMYAITLLGNRWLIGAMLLGIALWVVRTGRCRTPLGVMVAAFVFNPVLEALLKGLVGRQRPELAQLVSGDGPAFPSGHVLATVGFYGVLAVVAWRSTTKRGFAIAGLVGAATVITLVGFSRIYLGVHWMTDVVGAFLVGTVFVLAAAYFLRGHNLGPSISCWLNTRGHRAHPVRVPSKRAL